MFLLGTPLKTTALQCGKTDMLRGTTNSVPLLLKTLQRLPIFLLRLLTWLTDAVCDHAPSCFSYVLSHLPITVHPTASWQGDSERVSAPQTLTFWLLGFCIHPLCLLFISLTPISVLRFLLGFFSFFPLVVPSFLIYVLLRCVPPPHNSMCLPYYNTFHTL